MWGVLEYTVLVGPEIAAPENSMSALSAVQKRAYVSSQMCII